MEILTRGLSKKPRILGIVGNNLQKNIKKIFKIKGTQCRSHVDRSVTRFVFAFRLVIGEVPFAVDELGRSRQTTAVETVHLEKITP